MQHGRRPHNPVAAGAIGFIEGFVGAFEHGVVTRHAQRRAGNSDAHGDAQILVRQNSRGVLNGRAHSFGGDLRGGRFPAAA